MWKGFWSYWYTWHIPQLKVWTKTKSTWVPPHFHLVNSAKNEYLKKICSDSDLLCEGHRLPGDSRKWIQWPRRVGFSERGGYVCSRQNMNSLSVGADYKTITFTFTWAYNAIDHADFQKQFDFRQIFRHVNFHGYMSPNANYTYI